MTSNASASRFESIVGLGANIAVLTGQYPIIPIVTSGNQLRSMIGNLV
jgi:hypothetical protein